MNLPDCLVKGSTEELAAVFTEAETRYSFTVGTFKPPQTLTTLDLPHLSTQKQLAQQNVSKSLLTILNVP